MIRVGARSVIALTLATAVGLIAFGWPFLAGSGEAQPGHLIGAPYLFMLLLPLVLAVVLAQLSEGGMDAKAVAMLGVLSAVGTALRALSPGTAGFEPVLFLLVLAGRVFGAAFGFALGSIVITASALATAGVGPWMPFQMVAYSWIGLGAGCLSPVADRLARRLGSWAERLVLAAYAAVAGFLFGALLNLWFWPLAGGDAGLAPALTFVPGATFATNLAHYVTFYAATSLGWDLIRAAVNATLVLVLGRPVLAALRRAARRAAFEAPVRFAPSSTRADGVSR